LFNFLLFRAMCNTKRFVTTLAMENDIQDITTKTDETSLQPDNENEDKCEVWKNVKVNIFPHYSIVFVFNIHLEEIPPSVFVLSWSKTLGYCFPPQK